MFRTIKKWYKHKTYRKFVGGYWECWTIEILGHVHFGGPIWFQVTKEDALDKNSCPIGAKKEIPLCEYYPLKFYDYKTKLDITTIYRQHKLERILKT